MNEKELILTALKNCDRTSLYANPQPLTPEQQQRYQEIIQKRTEGEPLQYLLGFTEFMGLKLHVDHSVLIPRPETEILVEKAIERIKDHFAGRAIKILDLGTGSGNIAISLASFLKNVHVTTVDVSYEALSVARSNAKFHKLYDKLNFVCCDMGKFLETTAHTYDVIISNPPYIAANDIMKLPIDVQNEPHLALNGGVEGLDFYQKIITLGLGKLTKDGFCMMEIGDDQHEKIQIILEKHAPSFDIKFINDYREVKRIVEISPCS